MATRLFNGPTCQVRNWFVDIHTDGMTARTAGEPPGPVNTYSGTPAHHAHHLRHKKHSHGIIHHRTSQSLKGNIVPASLNSHKQSPSNFPVDPEAWNDIGLVPVVQELLPRADLTIDGAYLDRKISLGVGDVAYRFYPTLRLRNGVPHIVFYIAYNRNRERSEYVIGPKKLDDFLQEGKIYAIAAGNFYGFTNHVSRYEVLSSQVGYLFLRGNRREALRSLGRSWVAALQDPGWWTMAIMSTAVALPARAIRPVGGRVNVGGGFETPTGYTNLNPMKGSSGGPTTGIPNLVKGGMEEMGQIFESGSVQEMVSSKLRFGDVNWDTAASAAAKAMRPGGMVDMNVWCYANEQAALKSAFERAGFKNVTVTGDGTATMLRATR